VFFYVETKLPLGTEQLIYIRFYIPITKILSSNIIYSIILDKNIISNDNPGTLMKAINPFRGSTCMIILEQYNSNYRGDYQ